MAHNHVCMHDSLRNNVENSKYAMLTCRTVCIGPGIEEDKKESSSEPRRHGEPRDLADFILTFSTFRINK